MPDRTPETLIADAMAAYVLESGTSRAPAAGAPAFIVGWLTERGYEVRALVDPGFRIGDEIAYDTRTEHGGTWRGRVASIERDTATGDLTSLWVDFGHSLIRITDPEHLSCVRRTATLVPLESSHA